MSTVSKPAWELRLRQQSLLFKLCINLEDYSKIESLRVDPVESPDLDANTVAELNDINKQSAQRAYDEYGVFSRGVEAIKNDEAPDKPAWEQKIRQSGEDTRQRMNEVIDKGTERAVTTISKLPERSQELAAVWYEKGKSVVMKFFEDIWGAIQYVLLSIAEFFVGLWQKIKEAARWVANALEAVWNVFKPSSQFVYRVTDGRPDHLPVDRPKPHVVTAIDTCLIDLEKVVGVSIPH